jgi:hypothetical protein
MSQHYRALKAHDLGGPAADISLPVWEFKLQFERGYIDMDPERQRGLHPVTGKPMLDEKRVDQIAQDLLDGKAVIGQITLNYRADDPRTKFVLGDEELEVEGIGYVVDGFHRTKAIIKAADAAVSPLDPSTPVSIRVYSRPGAIEEPMFNGYNDGKVADPSRRHWLFQRDLATKLARGLVEKSPHLGKANVDVVTDRLSAKNPRLAAFNTFAKAFEVNWGGKDAPTADEAEAVEEFLVRFWDKLVTVLPDLRPMDTGGRQRVREESMVGSAIAIHGYVALGKVLYDAGGSLEPLEQLNDPAWFAKTNPEWTKRGILVPALSRAGEERLTMRNAIQTRVAMKEALLAKLGLTPEDTGSEEPPFVPAESKGEAVTRLATAMGVADPGLAPGSTEPKSIFVHAVTSLGLEIDTSMGKPELGEAIAAATGHTWDSMCDSRDTPSGGGDTVTLRGLNVVLEAVEAELA